MVSVSPYLRASRQDQREALGGEGLELVGVEMEGAALGGRSVGARERGLRDRGREQRAEQMRGAFAKPPFDRLQMTIAPSSISRRKRDGALRLRQHVAQPRLDERLADLVLDRGDGLGAEAVAIAGILVEPERAHHGIADVVLDELHAERLVDQQAGKHQQRCAGHVEQARARRW